MNMLGEPIYQGRGYDLYSGNYLLLDRTNRTAVGEVNFEGEINYKGLVTNQISNKWMQLTKHIIGNHIITANPHTLLALGAKTDQIGRAVIAKDCFLLPFKFTVHGYYIPGSNALQDCDDTEVYDNLESGQKLESPILTISFMSESDDKMQTISFEEFEKLMEAYIFELFDEIYEELDDEDECCGSCCGNHEDGCGGCCEEDTDGISGCCCGNNGDGCCGGCGCDNGEELTFDEYCYEFAYDLCQKIRSIAMQLYDYVHGYAFYKEIIVANAELEFGLDDELNLVLTGHPFTPDTSCYWDALTHKVSKSPLGMDKQYLCDYIRNAGLSQESGISEADIPDYVLGNVSQIYCDIYHQLFDESIQKLTEDLLFEWHKAEEELGIIVE